MSEPHATWRTKYTMDMVREQGPYVGLYCGDIGGNFLLATALFGIGTHVSAPIDTLSTLKPPFSPIAAGRYLYNNGFAAAWASGRYKFIHESLPLAINFVVHDLYKPWFFINRDPALMNTWQKWSRNFGIGALTGFSTFWFIFPVEQAALAPKTRLNPMGGKGYTHADFLYDTKHLYKGATFRLPTTVLFSTIYFGGYYSLVDWIYGDPLQTTLIQRYTVAQCTTFLASIIHEMPVYATLAKAREIIETDIGKVSPERLESGPLKMGTTYSPINKELARGRAVTWYEAHRAVVDREGFLSLFRLKFWPRTFIWSIGMAYTIAMYDHWKVYYSFDARLTYYE